jgi:general secretion pathway protein I
LLEVMVAIAILAFALLSVSEIVSSALRSQVLARDLDVATLLARGKMAELTEKYERTGFRSGGEQEDGSFDDVGHPEVRWRAEVVEPPGTLDGKQLAAILIGDAGGLENLLAPKADANGLQQVNPAAGPMTAMIEAQLNAMADAVKKGVRELRLTVSWKDGAREESFGVVTHLVVLQPTEGLR